PPEGSADPEYGSLRGAALESGNATTPAETPATSRRDAYPTSTSSRVPDPTPTQGAIPSSPSARAAGCVVKNHRTSAAASAAAQSDPAHQARTTPTPRVGQDRPERRTTPQESSRCG